MAGRHNKISKIRKTLNHQNLATTALCQGFARRGSVLWSKPHHFLANFCYTFSIWFQFNGKDLPEGPKYRTKVRGNKVSLTMFEVTQDMTGYYTCIAKNELGTDTTRASMTVNKALSPGTHFFLG